MKKLMLMAAMLAVPALVAAPVIAQVAFEIGDTENESGGIGTSNELEIEGNNNNACLGQQQCGLQYASGVDDLEFSAGELSFAPESETACEQAVQQASAASSGLPK